MHDAVADRAHGLHAEEEMIGERARPRADDPADGGVRDPEREVEQQEDAAQRQQVEPPGRAEEMMIDVREGRTPGADDDDVVRGRFAGCRRGQRSVVSTTRNRAAPLIMRAYPSAARSRGKTSFIERTSERTLNASVSSESIDVPEYQPRIARAPAINANGEISSEGGAPRIMSVPRRPRPPTVALIAGPSVTVARTTAAPPSARARGSLSFPRAIATVRKPIFAAYWTPRWPRPPTPSTATRSPGRAPLFRSALNVVTPAHMSGAASTGESSSGTCATASARAIT